MKQNSLCSLLYSGRLSLETALAAGLNPDHVVVYVLHRVPGMQQKAHSIATATRPTESYPLFSSFKCSELFSLSGTKHLTCNEKRTAQHASITHTAFLRFWVSQLAARCQKAFVQARCLRRQTRFRVVPGLREEAFQLRFLRCFFGATCFP